jgi:putative endonuclease
MFPKPPPFDWSVYIFRCRDGSLYTGIAKDVDRRARQHNCGRGARYTRAKGGGEVVWRLLVSSQRSAMQIERTLKRLPRAVRQAIVGGG